MYPFHELEAIKRAFVQWKTTLLPDQRAIDRPQYIMKYNDRDVDIQFRIYQDGTQCMYIRLQLITFINVRWTPGWDTDISYAIGMKGDDESTFTCALITETFKYFNNNYNTHQSVFSPEQSKAVRRLTHLICRLYHPEAPQCLCLATTSSLKVYHDMMRHNNITKLFVMKVIDSITSERNDKITCFFIRFRNTSSHLALTVRTREGNASPDLSIACGKYFMGVTCGVYSNVWIICRDMKYSSTWREIPLLECLKEIRIIEEMLLYSNISNLYAEYANAIRKLRTIFTRYTMKNFIKRWRKWWYEPNEEGYVRFASRMYDIDSNR